MRWTVDCNVGSDEVDCHVGLDANVDGHLGWGCHVMTCHHVDAN